MKKALISIPGYVLSDEDFTATLERAMAHLTELGYTIIPPLYDNEAFTLDERRQFTDFLLDRMNDPNPGAPTILNGRPVITCGGPIPGIENPTAFIEARIVINLTNYPYERGEHVDPKKPFYNDYEGNIVYFCKGWRDDPICRLERRMAARQGVECVYEEGTVLTRMINIVRKWFTRSEKN